MYRIKYSAPQYTINIHLIEIPFVFIHFKVENPFIAILFGVSLFIFALFCLKCILQLLVFCDILASP